MSDSKKTVAGCTRTVCRGTKGARAAVEFWLDRLPVTMRAADLISFAEELEHAVAAKRDGFSPPEFWAGFASALRAVAAENRGGVEPAPPTPG